MRSRIGSGKVFETSTRKSGMAEASPGGR
jgi:hypothetical protein